MAEIRLTNASTNKKMTSVNKLFTQVGEETEISLVPHNEDLQLKHPEEEQKLDHGSIVQIYLKLKPTQ